MKTKERIKTILLFVLILGAVFMTYLNWTSYTARQNSGGGIVAEFTAAAQGKRTLSPFAISYKTEAGRFGAAYHGGSVNAIYNKVNHLIARAFSDTSGAVSASEEDWKEALSANGILVDYEGNIPVYLIVKDEGKVADNIFGRYLVLNSDGVFFKDVQNGTYHKFSHDISEEELLQTLSGLNATKCMLAHEAGSSRVTGETLVFDTNISSFVINSANAASTFGEAQLIALLKIFGMNYNTCGKHTEQDGSHVYIEDLSTLKISPDGYLTFESEEQGELALTIAANGETPTIEEVVEGGDNLMNSLSAFVGGDGEIYLREVRNDSVKYGRSFGGIPIDRSGTGYSAEMYLEGNRVVKLTYHLRAYTQGNTVISALPQKLAIAAISGKTYGTISLRYNDNALGGIEAQWYVKK